MSMGENTQSLQNIESKLNEKAKADKLYHVKRVVSNNNKRCYGVIFDLLDGGMNKGLSEASKIANADKSPWGILFKPDDAASQIIWLLENQSKLLNGSIINLTGGVS